MILAEIHLKVLVNLRSYILKSEKILMDIKSKYSTKKKYTSMFLFNGEDIVELINKCCDKELVEKLKYISKNKYPNEVAENFCFIENFHKDNAILKLLVMNLDGVNIVNKAFIDENNPNYKIDLKFKNNTIYNAKSIENKRLYKFIRLYETVFNICTNKVVAENNYINKWLSLYEINEISRFINIINIGYERESFRCIEKRENILKINKNRISEYSREHEINVRKLFLENKIIILNYFLYHDELFEKIFNVNDELSS